MDADKLLRDAAQVWQPPPAPPLHVAAARVHRARRVRLAVALGTAAVVMIGGGTVLAAWPRSVPAVPATATPMPTPTAPATSPEAPPPTSPIQAPSSGSQPEGTSKAVAELTLRAREAALANGRGRTPITAEAVLTTASRAEQVLELGQVPSAGNQEVWVVQLRGQFVCDGCSRPFAAASPAGTVIQLVVGDTHSTGGSFSITRTPADLSHLGTVIHLELGALEVPPFTDPDPTATAVADKVRRQLVGIGHDDPVMAQAVDTTLGWAQRKLLGHTPYPPSATAVWFVELQGRFACGDCTRIGRATARAADVLTLVLDKASGAPLLRAVSNDLSDLTELDALPLDPWTLSVAPEWQPAYASYPAASSGGGDPAVLAGVLRLVGGCLVVESDAGPVHVPVLPTPSTSWSAIGQTLTVGAQRLREGDRVSWDGGYVTAPTDTWKVPDSCRGAGQEYFRVSQ